MPNLTFKINIDEAVRYMGYHSEPDEHQLEMIKELAGYLEQNLEPAYVYRVFGIEDTDGGIHLKGTRLILTGNDIKDHLRECDSVVLFCATVSSKADELIRQKEHDDIAKGFMTDCLSSAAVEAVCDQIEKELAARLSTKFFTWRFSPGYGDLPLDIQPQILEVLNAGKRAGITCNSSHMLVPSKSVTALIGLSDMPIDKGRRGCAVCNLAETCQFRKRGVRCGA